MLLPHIVGGQCIAMIMKIIIIVISIAQIRTTRMNYHFVNVQLAFATAHKVPSVL